MRSFVYITKYCKLCISLITRRLTLKFWLTIRNALLKHCKHQRQKNKFWSKPWSCLLKKMTSCMNVILIHSIFDILIYIFKRGGRYFTHKDSALSFLLMYSSFTILHVLLDNFLNTNYIFDTDKNVSDTFYIWNFSMSDANSQRFTKLKNLRLFWYVMINKSCLTLFVVRKHSIIPDTKVENLKNLNFNSLDY